MSEDNMDFLQKPVPPLRTRLVERFKSQPFIVIGWLGAFGSLAYGAYRYKTRGPSTKISVFVIQLRVLTQGAIVGSLFVGMLHHIYSQYNAKQNEVKK